MAYSLFTDRKLSRAYTHSLICYTSCDVGYVLINCFIFLIIRFLLVFLFCTFCLLYCVFCVFVLFCVLFLPIHVVVYCLFVYNFTDHCHRVETQLQLINVISYRTVTAWNLSGLALVPCAFPHMLHLLNTVSKVYDLEETFMGQISGSVSVTGEDSCQLRRNAM
jgi:hypothetical protein